MKDDTEDVKHKIIESKITCLCDPEVFPSEDLEAEE